MTKTVDVKKYNTTAEVKAYETKAVVSPYETTVEGIKSVVPEIQPAGEQPIESIVDTAQFYNEIRLEEGYTDTQNVEPLTNFADSNKPNGTQATPSKIAEFVADDINGHPSILLDGVDDLYNMGNHYQDVFNSDFAITFVVKVLNGRNTEVFFGANDDPNNHAFFIFMDGSGNLRFNYIENGNQAAYTSDSPVFVSGENPWKIITWWADFSNNQIKMRINGSDIATSAVQGDIANINPANFAVAINHFLFARNNQGSPDFFMNCNYAGKAIEKDPTLSSIENTEDELNSKYEIY